MIKDKVKHILSNPDCYITEHLYDNVYNIYDTVNHRFNIINMSTKKLLCKEWYSNISPFYQGYCVVNKYNPKTINSNYNFMDKNGKFLSRRWFYFAASFSDDGTAIIKFKNDIFIYLIDTRGNIGPSKMGSYLIGKG